MNIPSKFKYNCGDIVQDKLSKQVGIIHRRIAIEAHNGYSSIWVYGYEVRFQNVKQLSNSMFEIISMCDLELEDFKKE